MGHKRDIPKYFLYCTKKMSEKNMAALVLGANVIRKIHPLTVVADRYGGSYSGGAYLAFNLDPCLVPAQIDCDDYSSGDGFWVNEEKFGQYKIGKGESPNDACIDLFIKLQE